MTQQDTTSFKKVAVLTGLTAFGGGVCGANAATTAPHTDTFLLSVTGDGSGQISQNLSFPQFNPALGTLTGVEFSLNSNLFLPEGTFFGSASISVNSVQLSSQNTLGGYNFTNLTGLQAPLTTAFYTGTSNFNAALLLTNSCFITATWTGNGAFSGLTLVYDYTPTPAVPLPGALPLFASGAAGIGLTAWRSRRKRKAKPA